jgi:hypothetical protein
VDVVEVGRNNFEEWFRESGNFCVADLDDDRRRGPERGAKCNTPLSNINFSDFRGGGNFWRGLL